MTHQSTGRVMPWRTPWPNEGLEPLAHCPVCGDSEREMLHPELIDNAFWTAPGKWTLWTCARCSSAYLDPRPTRDTIHLAYARYYTHQETAAPNKASYASLSPFRKLRRRFLNGYTNWRYSTNAAPSCVLGVPAIFVTPGLKRLIDQQYRHLPQLPREGGRLLDVGCGDGAFLSHARNIGWDAVGVDPDPKAVANATKRGLDVHQGGLELFERETELFDVITLCHVIEHVHDPVNTLRTCHALLKPGGQLWLSTPNINSFGHARFKRNWRGLETPRHLVLFNRHSLGLAFTMAGFPTPIDRVCPSPCKGMFKMSFAMERGNSQYDYAVLPTPIKLQLQAASAALMENILPSRREFLIVTARKAPN